MTVNYRIITIFASVASAILCAISLAFTITAIVSYRAEDFFTATQTTDFTTLGTCVETVTDAQLQSYGYQNHDIDCKLDTDTGNKGRLRNTLAVSVHGLYYTMYDPAARDYVGDVPPIYDVADIQDSLLLTGASVLTATVGGAGTLPPGVNFSTAYLALRYVAEQKVPTSCDAIYGLTEADIEADAHGQVAFMANLREGRLNDVGDVKTSWPLNDIVVDCNGGLEATPGTAPIDTAAPVSDAQKALLHAHCYTQFLFASVGTTTNDGTFTVPLPGIDAGPGYIPYPQADGFNSSSTYSTKARMYLGQRFGLSLWAYVPMILCTCFLLADSVVFFLAETAMPGILENMQVFSTTRLSYVRDSLVIAATSKTSRRRRFAIGCVAVFFSILFYAIFIVGPWGFVYTRMPRPVCEEGAPDHASPAFGLWRGTHGGWKSDWDATWYDLAAIITQVFVLLLLPITTSSLCRNLNKTMGRGNVGDGRLLNQQVVQTAELVHNSAPYRQMMNVFFLPLVLGIVVLIVGQAASGARFGMAWAEGVVAQEVDAYGVLIFDEVKIAELVYDQTVATIAVVVVCGLVFGAVLQRHLLSGAGCFSVILFFSWVALVLVFCLPLLAYAGIRSIFNHDAANRDCDIFPRSSHEFSNNLCTSRFWFFLVGAGIVAVVILAITILGLLQAIPAILRTRKKASVVYNQGGIANAPNKGSRFFREGPTNNVSAPLVNADESEEAMLGGYKSSSEGFFNFKTQMGTTDTNQFLYAPRMAVPPARR